ncbi:MAG TPA: lysylphosphatidylglycerol synthase transmembrane domain-containing protein [Gemmatimonadaceae bacterium]|nr:lysylphosphatidylglycerol synthase transmembrane domain-containing protein [Gemmatimonadaceae bacterium]
MKGRWRSALGIALSVALLVWALHDVDLAQVWTNVRHSNGWFFLGATIAGTLIVVLRAIRWRYILAPIARDLPFGQLWRATAIGVMVTNVIPLRAGELARAYALARETPRVSFSAAFASIAVDRVFDTFVVLLLAFAAVLSPNFPRGSFLLGKSMSSVIGMGALLVAVALFVLYLIVFFPGRLIRIYEAFARRVVPRLEERGRQALLAFAAGLGVLRSPRHFAIVFLWTLAHWLLDAFAFWLGFKAVGIAAPFSAALILQLFIAISVALPSSPGFWGAFEALSVAGLAIYGVPPTLALSWALGYHILTFIPITLIGAYYFVHLGLHFREIRAEEAEPGDAEQDVATAGAPVARRSTGDAR